MFKVYKGSAFIIDVHASNIADAVAIFTGLYHKAELVPVCVARRLWRVGDFEMAQVM